MANPNTGRFNWHELMMTDADVSVKFYTQLFGWTVQEMDMGPAGKYRLFNAGGVPVGGAIVASPGVPSNWLVYVAIEDTHATVKKVGELGGKVMVPPTEVPGMVHFAIAVDPHGAAFGVVKGLGPNAADPPYDGPPRHNTFVWDELHTSDKEGAAKFYTALFGWGSKVGTDAMQYHHWLHTPNGKDIGGMMKLMQPGVPPHWLAYVGAADVDAQTKKVKELGGKVLMDPMTIEKVGKFSVVQDPSGATFALYRDARL